MTAGWRAKTVVLVLIGAVVNGGCGSSSETFDPAEGPPSAATTLEASTTSLAPVTTLSASEQKAKSLGKSLAELVSRYEGLVGRAGDAKAAWVAVDDQVWAARRNAARLPDYEGSGQWLSRKTEMVSRADLLTLQVVEAIGAQRTLDGSPIDGSPDTTGGVLNELPAEWDGLLAAVRAEIDALHVAVAQTLLDDLTARVDDLNSKLLILDDSSANAEGSVAAQARVLLWESTETIDVFDAAIAAEAAGRHQSSNGSIGDSSGKSPGTGSSGAGGNSGGSSRGGGGNSGGSGSSGGGGDNSAGGGKTQTGRPTCDLSTDGGCNER